MKPQRNLSIASKIVVTLMIVAISVGSITSLAATTKIALKLSSQGQIMYQLPLSRLHTDGEYIKDDQDQIVRLTGVGLDASYIAQDLAAWGRPLHLDKMIEAEVKIVRIFICYGWWTGEYTDYSFDVDRDVYRACIDDLVASFNYAGIYCWINMEGGYAKQQEWSYDSSNWALTLQEIALRYQDYPNMLGIEPQNEPTDWCWEDRYYVRLQEVAHAIHEVAPNLIVFADSGVHGWNSFTEDFPLDEPNVVYAYHMYYQHWDETLKNLYRNGQYAEAKILLENTLVSRLYWLKNQGYPVMDTEFAVMRTDDFPAYNVFLQDYFDVMDKYGIHWTYFGWYSQDGDACYELWQNNWAEPTPQGEIVFANIEPLLPS
ncbi:hypothetical protein D4R86_03145 [bacterium]|nr:MAG: hypothetical protein D4R86_03145 [bacterium]